VREVMSTGVVTCGRWDDIRIAEELMARHHMSRIMCVDEAGVLIGVISLSDIAEKEQGPQAAQVLRELTHREAAPAMERPWRDGDRGAQGEWAGGSAGLPHLLPLDLSPWKAIPSVRSHRLFM
jgi:CBS domain-containing protein